MVSMVTVRAGGGICPNCGFGEYDTVADGKCRQDFIACCRSCGQRSPASSWLAAERKQRQTEAERHLSDQRQARADGFAAVTTFRAGEYELEVSVFGYPTAERAAVAAATMKLVLRGQRPGDGLTRLVASVPGGEVVIDAEDLHVTRLRDSARGKGIVVADDFEPMAGVAVGDLPALLRHTGGVSGEITFGSLSYTVRDVAAGALVQPTALV